MSEFTITAASSSALTVEFTLDGGVKRTLTLQLQGVQSRKHLFKTLQRQLIALLEEQRRERDSQPVLDLRTDVNNAFELAANGVLVEKATGRVIDL